MDGDKVSEKFSLRLGSGPSLFEGKTIPPRSDHQLKLQVLAADQAGNFGQHIIPIHIHP